MKLSDYLRQIRAARARSGAVAATAGSRGHSAEPLEPQRRERNYQLQNGCERLTPKQRRRANHKDRYAQVHGSAA